MLFNGKSALIALLLTSCLHCC